MGVKGALLAIDGYNEGSFAVLPIAERRYITRLSSAGKPEWVTNQLINATTHAFGFVITLASLLTRYRTAGFVTVPELAMNLASLATYFCSAYYHCFGLSGKDIKTYKITRLMDHLSVYVTATTSVVVSVLELSKLYQTSLPAWFPQLPIALGLFSIYNKLKQREHQKTLYFLASAFAVGLTAMLGIVHVALQPHDPVDAEVTNVTKLVFTSYLFIGVGAVLYGLRWPTIIKGVLASHEIWHCFVLLSGGCMNLAILLSEKILREHPHSK